MMKKTIFILSIYCIFISNNIFAKVDTIKVECPEMNCEIQNLVIHPHFSSSKHYPVIYLLHGYDGDCKSWLKIKPNLPKIAEEEKIILVCPNGANSWYWDSPINNNLKYESYIINDLIKYIDDHYPTTNNKNQRAITGYSMGGEGAFWLTIMHPNLFGGCGAMSGGVNLMSFTKNWNLEALLGNPKTHSLNWKNHSITNLLRKIQSDSLAIIFDCGTSDFFYSANLDLHKCMENLQIKHTFISRPGMHNNDYWKNAIDYQILFFKKFFSRK